MRFAEKWHSVILPPHELEDEKCAPFTREVRTSRFRARNEGFWGILGSCQNLSFFDPKKIEDFWLVFRHRLRFKILRFLKF